MNNRELDEVIRTNVPGIMKDIVALKAWKEEPKDIPKFEGRYFPGICSNIGEVLITKETRYVTIGQEYCGGGTMSFGLRPPRTKQEMIEAQESHLKGDPRGHIDVKTAVHYYWVEERKESPYPKEKNVAIQIGLLKDIEEPDVVLIFCTPQDADVIMRAYTFPTGDMLKGFGSHGGCSFTLRYPYVRKEPTFTIGDPEWRHYIGLEDSELTLSFPYQDFQRWIEYLPIRADYYKTYRKVIAYRRYTAPNPSREIRDKFFGK